MAEESISDEVLGELKLEDGYWIGETEIRPDHVVGISLSFDEDDVAPLLVQSRSILKLLRQDEIEYRRGIADRMLELYNETWSDGEKIDRDTFADKIHLDAITFYSHGAEAFYYDGDLFAGHWIMVDINTEGVIEDAYIAG